MYNVINALKFEGFKKGRVNSENVIYIIIFIIIIIIIVKNGT